MHTVDAVFLWQGRRGRACSVLCLLLVCAKAGRMDNELPVKTEKQPVLESTEAANKLIDAFCTSEGSWFDLLG